MRTRNKITKYCAFPSRNKLQCCCFQERACNYTNVHVLVSLNFLNEDDSFPKKICFHCKVKRLDPEVNVEEVSRTCVVFRQLSKKDQ